MANNDLLSGISQKDIKVFSKDFSQLLRVASEIDKYYAEWKQDIDKYLPKFEEFVNLFNKKYKNIKVKVLKKIDGINVKVLLNEKTVKELFNNCASRIIGLKSIGTKNFGAADITETGKFADEIDKIKDSVYLTYYLPETGIYSVFLSKSKNEKMVELHWEIKESVNEPSPDFRICAYYALKDGYNKKSKLFDEGGTFGFTNLLTRKERHEWLHKFNPHVLE